MSGPQRNKKKRIQEVAQLPFTFVFGRHRGK
jgi:hypothetical protein